MVSEAITPSFPRFSVLAPELRNYIWEYALPEYSPDKFGPALVRYKSGCWHPHNIGPDVVLQFHHEMLDAAVFEMPMAFVNREAHGVAKAWVRKHRFTIHVRRRRGQDPIFVRTFDPANDALYVEPSQGVRFCDDWDERACEGDLLHEVLTTQASIERLALSQKLLQGTLGHAILTIDCVPETTTNFVELRELLVVVNEAENLPLAVDREGWEFVDTGGDIFFWNFSRDRFELEGGPELVGDGVVAELVKYRQYSYSIHSIFSNAINMDHWAPNGFRIRPVKAVRRQHS